MKGFLSLFFLSSLILLGFISTVFADVPFDTTKEKYCLKSNGGCSFTNSSIWVGGVVPSGVNVHVNISGANNYSSSLLIYFEPPIPNTPLVIGTLFVHNAEFALLTNASMQAGSINIHDYGILTLEYSSYTSTINENIYSNPQLLISSTATLTVADGSSLVWPYSTFLLGSISFGIAQQLSLTNVTYAATTASFAQMFSVPYLTILPDINAQFPTGLQVDVLSVYNKSITLIQGSFSGELSMEAGSEVSFYSTSGNIALSGAGQVNIYGSQLTITTPNQIVPPPEFYGAISLFGSSSISFNNFNAPNISITNNVIVTGNGLILSGTTSVFGTLIASQNGVNVTGNVTIYGEAVLSDSRLVIANDAIFSVPDFSFLTSHNATIVVMGIFAGNLVIPVDAHLVILGQNTSILGNVKNSGLISAGELRQLNVYGDFSQDGNGTLFFEIDNYVDPGANIIGATALDLDGKLHFRFVKKPPKSKKFAIITTINGSNITGTFKGDALPTPGSVVSHNLKLEYSEQSIILVYKAQLPGWIWGVVGVGIAIVVIVVGMLAFILMKRRHSRSTYETL